jgi:hypothetical protein
MKYIKLLLLLLLLSAKILFAQWLPSAGINGGYCKNIIQVDSTLFMFCTGVGIVKQNVGDTNWVKVYEQTSYGLISVGNVLFTQSGIYQTNTLVRSFNSGITWEVITYDTLSLEGLTKAGDELFAWDGIHHSVVRSDDFGSSWTNIIDTGEESYCMLFSDFIQLYYFNMNNPEYLVVFNPLNNSIDSILLPNNSLIFDVQNYDSSLLVISDSLFNYSYNLQQWTVTPNVNLIENFVVIDTVLCGLGSKGIFRFNRTNGNWEDCNDGLQTLNVKGLLFKDGNYYCTADKGTYKSDSSFIWQSNNSGLNGANIIFIAADETEVLISTSVGLYKSIDGGAFFDKMADGIFNKIILTDSAYYLLGKSCLMISHDKGENWNSFPFDFLPSYGSVSDIGVGSKYIFAVAWNITGEKLYRTKYDPINWEPVQGSELQYLRNLAVHDTIVMLSKNYSSTLADPVLISLHNGENPEIVAEFHDLNAVDVKFQNNRFYASHQNQIAFSFDNSQTWEYITVPDYSMTISDFDHDSANLIVAGWYYGYSPKAYNSYNNGTSWTDVTGNLQHPLDHTLTKTKISGNRILMGTPTCGLLYRDDLLTELHTPIPKFENILNVLPNPNNGEFEFELFVDHESSGILKITELNGKIIRFDEICLHSGMNRIKYMLKNTEGLFLVELITNENIRYSGKVLIIR